jgi:hypothetical protein
MATDITVYLDDQPGELARLSRILGDADVNIEGMCAVTSGGGAAEVHVLVDDLAPALEALEGAGVEIAGENEVIVVPLEDRPGALAEVARRLGEADINITPRLPGHQHPPGVGHQRLRRRDGDPAHRLKSSEGRQARSG